MRLLLSVLTLSVYSWAQPQPQIPKPKDGGTATQKTNANRQNSPTVNPQPTAGVGANSEEHQTNKIDNDGRIVAYTQELAKYTGRLALYTLAVAFFTAVLVLVGLLQFGALSRQAEALKHHSALIERSVEQMKGAVVAYERYVGVGEQALALTRKSNEITKEATDLTRQSFLLAHRPKLIVRNIVMTPSPWEAPVAPFQPGKPVTGQFYVSNIGGTPATVTESHCEVLFTTYALPMKRPYEGKESSNPNPVPAKQLAPGASCPSIFGGATPIKQTSTPETLYVYVLGWIEYADDLKPATIRRTAFCRQFNPNTGRFVVVNDPDYEHAE